MEKQTVRQRQTDIQTFSRQMDVWTYEWTNGWMDGQLDRRTLWLIDRWTYEWNNEVNRWIDILINVECNLYKKVLIENR